MNQQLLGDERWLEHWDHEAIEARSAELFDLARVVWPHPEGPGSPAATSPRGSLQVERAVQGEAVRMTEQNGVRRPQSHTLCGKAWAVFDDLSKNNGSPASIGEALQIARQQGLNEGNVRAEFYQWRKFHGIRQSSPTSTDGGRGAMSQADEIRQYALEHFILPARAVGRQEVVIRAGDVHKEMALANAMPAVCSALHSKKFERLAAITKLEVNGPEAGSNVYFCFSLEPSPAPKGTSATLPKPT